MDNGQEALTRFHSDYDALEGQFSILVVIDETSGYLDLNSCLRDDIIIAT